ncbi:carbonic anhydrase [Candidatus Protochlamydia amoebophila]|nr:carbonic anhydrase [Candidatus Protochlamydia amoebophila]
MKLQLFLFATILNILPLVYVSATEEKKPANSEIPQTQDLVNQVLTFARSHQDFKNLYFKEHEHEFIRLAEQGQNPHTLFIGCSDSRMVPDLILGTKPGELFVIRTAGNFVPPYDQNGWDGVSATIQYALEALDVKHIIICGHSHCGAIKGLFQTINSTQLGILKRWLQFGNEAKETTMKIVKPETSEKDLYTVAEQISVVYQLAHLMTFPAIKKKVDEKTLDLHGWYYKIETGEVSYYDPETFVFKPLKKLKAQALQTILN